jgi:allene oxide cyclase
MSSRPLNLTGPRRRWYAVLATAALACAVVVGTAASRADAARARKSADTTVHVIEHAVTDTAVHSGGGKDKTGNTLTFHNKVYDPADKKQVGTDQGFCMRISPAEGSWECFWTTFLAHGQITVEGPFYDTKNSVLAITGGTGAYRDARGEMNLNSRHGGTEFDFIFHVDR